MIADFAAAVAAYHAREMPPAQTKVDRAVARTLAGESLREIGWDLDLEADELREASLRVNAAKPKPKKVRQRPVYRRAV